MVKVFIALSRGNLAACVLTSPGVLLALILAGSIADAQSLRPGMGATPYADASGTGCTFRVWAPNATTVSVPGTFNGWNTTANFLVEEGDSGVWSADVATARTGHEYKYLINGVHWWKDPRSRKVTSSGYNAFAANSIIYDSGAFDWQGDTRPSMDRHDLVIYEMHIGAFYDPSPLSGGPGRFSDAVAKLDYLAGLGVNAVELLPIAEFPGDRSWGYNPADIYAVENAGYGGPDGLKLFVREAHARGIRVLLDIVHNHWGPNDLELYGFDVGPQNRFYLYTGSGICCTPWGDRPNYSNEGVRSFIIDNFRMWLEEYHMDGFRWDAVGAMRHYEPGHVSIPAADSLIQYVNSAVIGPDAISIAEDDSFGLGFDGEWDRGFGDVLIHTMVQMDDAARDMNALAARINGTGNFRVLYSESHDLVGDLNGPSNQRLPRRIDSGDAESYYARKRSMLAAAVVLTSPGTPMLFMGQEFLETRQFSSATALDWGRVDTRADVVRFYRDMIHLRRNLDGVSHGLTGPSMSWHVIRNDAPWKLLAFHRWGAGPDDQVMVVMNFTAQSVPSYWIHSWPENGPWYVNLNSDWTTYGSDFSDFGTAMVNVNGGSGEVAIGPYSVLVLSRKAHPEVDADGDGLLNGWEEQYFGGPTNAIAQFDDDGDGASNLAEQAADTDPTSSTSALRFIGAIAADGGMTLTWTGGSTARQVIESSVQLTGAWNPVHTNEPPTAITNSIEVPYRAATGATLFRIRIER